MNLRNILVPVLLIVLLLAGYRSYGWAGVAAVGGGGIALTRSLGRLQSPADTQPEIYRWMDTSGSQVDCEFRNGKLVQWQLQRPMQPEADTDTAAQATTP